MDMFTRDNHITIPGWVITDLQLTGNDAICYSIIYGFSQDEEGEFYGSLAYLATAMGMARPNVKRILNRLLEKGLIKKREEKENGVKYCRYSVINLNMVLSNRQRGCYQNDNRGVIKTITNNIEDNIGDNIIPPLYPPTEETYPKNKKAQVQPNPPVAATPLPYNSPRFQSAWKELMTMPKWRHKTQRALKMALNKLAAVSEADAIEAIECTIAGDYQGIFPKNNHPQAPKERVIDIKDIL